MSISNECAVLQWNQNVPLNTPIVVTLDDGSFLRGVLTEHARDLHGVVACEIDGMKWYSLDRCTVDARSMASQLVGAASRITNLQCELDKHSTPCSQIREHEKTVDLLIEGVESIGKRFNPEDCEPEFEPWVSFLAAVRDRIVRERIAAVQAVVDELEINGEDQTAKQIRYTHLERHQAPGQP